ncbi:MAG: hypothetical protein J5601_04265 [Elusimicrobiaceae bacterium]|nr:hypothetical protein [Elusimicrobiaceae bacterium]
MARTKEERAKFQLNFDRKKIFVIRNGKKINQYDEIQANNVDTDIYAVIEKYHGDERAAIEAMKSNIPLMYGEFQNMDLKDLELRHKKNLEMWNDLPLTIREQFHNNPNEFAKDGEKWLKEQLEQLEKTENNNTTTESNEGDK